MREVRNRCSPINLTLTKRPRAQRLLRCKGTRTENSTSASASPPALLLGPLPFSQPTDAHGWMLRCGSRGSAARIPRPIAVCWASRSFGLGPLAALTRCHLPGGDRRNRLHCCSSAAGMEKVFPEEQTPPSFPILEWLQPGSCGLHTYIYSFISVLPSSL